MKIYIDLLPEERKNEIKRKKLFRLIVKQEVLFLFPLLVLIVIMLDIYWVLGIQKNSMIETGSLEQNQGKYKELSEYEDKFKEINTATAILNKLQQSHLSWSNLIEVITKSTPDGIYLTDFANKDYQILLTGKARNRESLIAYKEALIASGCADNVNVPLSNLVNKTDVDFQLDFMVKQECIKKK
jgi:type IV pilus assembly protein PilN